MAEETLSNQPNTGPTGGDEPLSFDEGIASLESLVEPEEQVKPQVTEETKNESEDEVEEQPEDEDSEAEETTGDTDEEEEEDGSEESQETEEDGEEPLHYADDVVVELEGEETTLGAIVEERLQERVKSFQADYTRKTQAVAEERRVIDSQAEQLQSIANQTKEQRETFLAFQQQFAPDPPDIGMVESDPIGYQQQKAYYDQWQEVYSDFAQENQRYQLQQQEQIAQQQQSRLEKEKQLMVQTVPELGTAEGFTKFKQDLMQDFVPHYGYTAEDLNMITDHRFAKLAKDAMAYQKLQKTAPDVKKKLEGKPKILKPSAKKQKSKVSASKARAQRLAKTGDLDDAISALMDMDL